MEKQFNISMITENGHQYYKVYDYYTGCCIYCEIDKLNETMWKLLEVSSV